MSDQEFDILDELYFIISFEDLKEKLTNMSLTELKETLKELAKKGWINYFTEPDGEQSPKTINFVSQMEQLYFLASKKGLFAHNSI